jgi:hypothetical protein
MKVFFVVFPNMTAGLSTRDMERGSPSSPVGGNRVIASL